MGCVVEITHNSIGFGKTKSEAEEDCYNSSCIVNPKNDKFQKFTKRIEEMCAWSPTQDILHIHTLGCLCIVENKIYNLANNLYLPLSSSNKAIVYYCAKLLNNPSYTDLFVCAREALNTFFKTKDSSCISMEDYPRVKIEEPMALVYPSTTYCFMDDSFLTAVNGRLEYDVSDGSGLVYALESEHAFNCAEEAAQLFLKAGSNQFFESEVDNLE